MLVKKGRTNVSVVVRIVDSGDGTPETGVVFGTSGIDLWYRRENNFKVSITEADLATPDLEDPHLDGGFLTISDGYYRLDVPDLAFATGEDGVQIGGTVTGMVVFGPYVQLTDLDVMDVVRGGMTALPNAAADGIGGLPISDAGGLDIDAVAVIATSLADGGFTDALLDTIKAETVLILADTANMQPKFTGITLLNEWLGAILGKQNADATALAEIKASGAGSGTYDPNTDSIEAIRDTAPMGSVMVGTDNANTTTPPTVGAIADAVLNELTAGHTTAGSLSKAIIDILADTADMQPRVAAIEIDTNAIQGKLPTNKFMGSSDGADDDGTLNAITAAGPTKTQMDTAHGLLATPAQVITQVNAAWTTQMADSVATDGSRPTRDQALREVLLFLTEFGIAGTSYTVTKEDGSTATLEYTLDDAATPTAITKSTNP